MCHRKNMSNQIPSAFSQIKYYLGMKGFSLRVLSLPWTINSRVIFLNLPGNQIKEIPIGTFARCPSLNYLILSNNSISHLPDSIFHPLTRLKHLDLSENKISQWDQELILGLHFSREGQQVHLPCAVFLKLAHRFHQRFSDVLVLLVHAYQLLIQ